jgi:hypothetical protein
LKTALIKDNPLIDEEQYNSERLIDRLQLGCVTVNIITLGKIRLCPTVRNR